jgi:23S rRNA (guanosine2251-2'-O)-methyltransferase
MNSSKIYRNTKLKENKSLYVYGIQPVIELLKSRQPASQLIIAKETEEKLKNIILKLAQQKNIEVKYIPKQQMQRFTGPVLHQGIAAELKPFRYINENVLLNKLLENENVLIVILDQIQDPHNLGAIIRTAEITGSTCVILPEKGSAHVNSTVVKTSAGAVFHIPIHQTSNLFALIENLKNKNIQIIAAEEGQQNNLFKTDLSSKVALIIGSEGTGVRKNLKNFADRNISIPQFGRVNSLNASVSTAVILYEIIRQRNFREKP